LQEAVNLSSIAEVVDLSQYDLENKIPTTQSTGLSDDFENMKYTPEELVDKLLAEESVD
ncbi:5697_t:CDS:2, partial [Cetraspora pellucida]